ncbi:MAG TPA: MFS transporter [Rugosimonospora sp.]|nr:MFS transporter [Rugosimonospora sp.]
MVRPLALAQFICSYAATSLNVAISPIARDLHTTVFGVQASITLFTLTMAALMIPGSKLTDIWGRRRCLVAGLLLYGAGALLAALAPGIGVLILGNSVLEGVGSALLVPPIYILVTVASPDLATRARYFGLVSGAGALGAATGPLIGGTLTSLISWRASFLLQVLVVAGIIALARRIPPDERHGPRPRFDLTGAVLSAAGLFFVVSGTLQSATYGWFTARTDVTIGGRVLIPQGGISPVWLSIGLGVLILAGFGWHLRSAEQAGRVPLLRLRLFADRTANLGLGTQGIQWLVMQGTFFVTAVFLQEARGYTAIQTGLILTPATAGILAASFGAERFARRRAQRWLVVAGFLITAAGTVLLLALVPAYSGVSSFVPGLLCVGTGVGVMLTSSVTIVQSAFPDRDQGDISGLSRAVSNLGSSLGTALVGSILVGAARPGGRPYAASLVTLAAITVAGLALAVLIPRRAGPGRS